MPRTSHVRLLGKCPNCKADDSLVLSQASEYRRQSEVSTWETFVCTDCGVDQYYDWRDNGPGEKSQHIWAVNSMLYTSVERVTDDVGRLIYIGLTEPMKSEVPYSRDIVRALNAALTMKFRGLSGLPNPIGGVSGLYHSSGMVIANCENAIGLSAHPDVPQNRELRRVMKFYEAMLLQLFYDPLTTDGENYRCGAILRVDPNKPESMDESERLLRAAIAAVADERTADRALRVDRTGEFARYLTGKDTRNVVPKAERGVEGFGIA